ncbi:MAG: hypothetical protein ACKV2T_25435 [Kofleriaceae bacterium]
MNRVVKGLPITVLVVLVACSGGASGCKVKVSCGGWSSDDDREGVAIKAKFDGVATVTKSTHPDIKEDMHCKVVIEKITTKDLGDGRVNCFAGSNVDGGIVVYRGHADVKAELRTDREDDDRALWIDESADVRARIEYDGTRDPAITIRIWSVHANWEIAAETQRKEPS